MASQPTTDTASTPSNTTQPTTPSDAAILSHLENYFATRSVASPIYAYLLGTPSEPQIRFTSASKGVFTARLTLAAHHLNSGGGLHGSVSATIVDWAGGLAIATWDLRAGTGVSVDIHVEYLSSARLGDEVEIEGRVDRVGRSLAFTEVRIWKVDGEGRRGGLVTVGRHTKYVKESLIRDPAKNGDFTVQRLCLPITAHVPSETIKRIIVDYEYVLAYAETVLQDCIQGVSIAAHRVSIKESEKAIAEARDVTRLTRLATVFCALDLCDVCVRHERPGDR
ncbi:hypothetical protein VTJ49DRAFT_5741 [Mycothermus thermophilus]|uniref:Thioesterase domain-containing protein n=1 Tax=Humicola insolens TaxID=85995 RepID=A0ABR3V2I7_HUMIN